MYKVKDLMTHDVFTLKETENLVLAKSIMYLGRIRHIPIVDDQNNFIGLITHRDILSATISKLAGIDPQSQDELYVNIPIKEIMRTDIKSVSPETDLKEAAEILLKHKYGCLPIIEDGKLLGIITEADFLRLTVDLINAID